jgi:hypothetical protein
MKTRRNSDKKHKFSSKLFEIIINYAQAFSAITIFECDFPLGQARGRIRENPSTGVESLFQALFPLFSSLYFRKIKFIFALKLY